MFMLWSQHLLGSGNDCMSPAARFNDSWWQYLPERILAPLFQSDQSFSRMFSSCPIAYQLFTDQNAVVSLAPAKQQLGKLQARPQASVERQPSLIIHRFCCSPFLELLLLHLARQTLHCERSNPKVNSGIPFGWNVCARPCVMCTRTIFMCMCMYMSVSAFFLRPFLFSKRVPGCHMSHWKLQQVRHELLRASEAGVLWVGWSSKNQSQSRPLSWGRDNFNTTNVSQLLDWE